MSILKKRKKTTSQIPAGIIMGKPKNFTPTERRKRKKVKSRKSKKQLRRRKKLSISKLLFYIIVPLLLLSLLYISISYIINVRVKQPYGENIEEQFVIGLENIPAYPNSSFIFQNSTDEIFVANFISSGNSAYRLPLGVNIQQIYEFYENKLPKKGWTHVLSVPVGSETMKSGEYWISDEKGLRLYSKFNDIWYQTVTIEEAKTGLERMVAQETERALLLAPTDMQDLLPDFAWNIQIPKEYIVTYTVSSFENSRGVQFKKMGESEKVTITPVGEMGRVLDEYLNEYIEMLNKELDKTETKWVIENTSIAYTTYGTALKGIISFTNEMHDIAVVTNTYDKIVYVMDSNIIESPFFDYLFTSMVPSNLTSSESD